MTIAIFYKLLAIVFMAALGWVAGRMKWLGGGGTGGDDPSRILSNAAFYIFVPALLFRTTARLDFATLPWRTVAAFFVPAVGMLLAVYAWQRLRGAGRRSGAAAPALRAISATFGNSVQLGVPLATALFGEPGLAIHIALLSLQALVLLSVTTVLAEVDLAQRAIPGHSPSGLGATLAATLHNTVVHPVMLPVLAGLAWNFTSLGLHPVVDETLQVLGSAVVPVCLVLIGLSLAYSHVRGHVHGAIGATLLKLLAMPALVLVVAHWGFGLDGMPLAVLVVMAALPIGSNALIFAQRYATLEAEVTAAIVLSTLAFAGTLTLWLALLAWLG